MVNFGPLAAEIRSGVWGTQQISAVLRLGSITERHSSSGRQPTLWSWTEGATYIQQGGHRVGH